MQNPDDFSKLKSNQDKSYTKLELFLQASQITKVDWFDLRETIASNTTVREVHLRIEPEFVDSYPLAHLLELCQAIGQLRELKWLFVGQMSGTVTVFSQIPIQALTCLLTSAGDKLLWWFLRGCIVTHIYKGSGEEQEDKSGVLDVSHHREARKSQKDKKKKDKKKKKESKSSSKKSSKKEKKENNSDEEEAPSSKLKELKLDTKQAAAKRALEKLGDSIITLKSLKKFSFMGHFDEVMQGCHLDPILEGLSACEELELVVVAVTRHDGRIQVDPSALGGFLDASHPKLKEISLLYQSLTDDHIEEVASAFANNKNNGALEDLTIAGTGTASPESIGALFRATPANLKKLVLQELTLDSASVVAMCIALAHVYTLGQLEIQCALESLELVALQQMILANQGLESLKLYLTAMMDSPSAPLDLATSLLSNPKSKLSKVMLQGEDKNGQVKKFKEINVKDWEDVVEGIFKVERTETVDSALITLTKI